MAMCSATCGYGKLHQNLDSMQAAASTEAALYPLRCVAFLIGGSLCAFARA